MEYQREIKKNISVNGNPVFLNCLRLLRSGQIIDVSGDSTDELDREFYYLWKKCSHNDSVYVINPPDLCHIHLMFHALDGSSIASVCSLCTRCKLNTIVCHVPPFRAVKHNELLITDLEKFPLDVRVFERGDNFVLNPGGITSLPSELRKYVVPLPYTQESIVLRNTPVTPKRKSITVAEALKKKRAREEEVQYAVIVDGENVGTTTSTE